MLMVFLSAESSHILPRPKHSLFCRYEKEIKTFWWDARVYIYSRYVYIKLWLDHYNMRYQDLKRKSVD
jgi:hypothetical protein